MVTPMEKQTKEIIAGSLLGDGWLTAFKQRTKTSMYYVKCHSKNTDYLLWLRSQLMELSPSELKSTPKYPQHYFYTKARTDIGELRKLFYPNEGRKVIPENISDLLSPISLAVWNQDDGTLDRRSKYHWNAMLSTYCFSYEECILLAQVLQKNFGIETSVCKCQMRNKMYYRLYILSSSMDKFISVIKPHIHPLFNYKIALA